MTAIQFGFIVIVLAGLMEGNFAIPMKYMPRWNWENLWLVYSVFGLILLPWAVAFATVPQLLSIYGQATSKEIFMPLLFGAMWGIGNVLCGLGVALVGSGLGISIVVGLSAALGTLVPFLTLNSDVVFTHRGLMILAGVAAMAVGVLVCALAGMRREAAMKTATNPKGNFKGIVICVISGVASAFINFALAYGDSLRLKAENMGCSTKVSANVVWTWAMAGSFIVNAVYCLYLLRRNRSFPKFGEHSTSIYWFYSALMGLLLSGGILIYGYGAALWGRLGASIGWAVFLSITILAANISGFVTGEWKQAPSRATALMVVGSVILMAAAGMVGYANHLS